MLPPRYTPDSNAYALSIKNFGSLPEKLGSIWTMDLLNSSPYKIPLPRRLIVELLNSCNLDCPMCRVGRFGVNLERKLDIEQFNKLITELSGNLDIIRLNGLGESTLLPDFKEYLYIIFNKNITVELITNGSGQLDDYELIFKNNGIILVSWDAAEKSLFERLRRPAIWESQVSKLIDITRRAQKYGVIDRLFLIFTLQKLNISQLPLLIERCNKWGVKNVIVNVIKLSDESWINNSFADVQSSVKLAIEFARSYGISLMIPEQIGGRKLDEVKTLRTSSSICNAPLEEAVIRWNGDVQVCNMFNPYIYGNLYLNSFRHIWNNCFVQVFRKNINTPNKHPYCHNCVYMRDSYYHRTV